MIIYSLAKDNETLFATTDHEDFLNKCVALYDDVSDDTWPTYEDTEELPDIFESFGYVYEETDTDGNTSNSNNDIINLFNKLARFNPSSTYDDATTLIYGCNRLLIYYNEECKQYIGDTENELSLLQLIAGDDGFEQLYFHKDFRSAHGVSIY